MACFPAELYLVLDNVSEAEACVMETSSMFPLSHQVYFMVGFTWRPVCLGTCSFGHVMSLRCMFCHLCHVMLLPAAFFLLFPCLVLFLVRCIRSCLVASFAPSFYVVLFLKSCPSVVSSHLMEHFHCFVSCVAPSLHDTFSLFPVF